MSWFSRAVCLVTASALLVGVSSTSLLVAPAAQAAPTPTATVTKVGRDLTHPSTASAGAPGSAQPGDTVQWAVSYGNQAAAAAGVALTDPITDGQSYVPNSLQLPPGFTGGVSNNTLTASGTVPKGSTSADSPTFAGKPVSFSTPGGDGYSVEGYKGNIYTVYHHNDSKTSVFCATMSGAVCPGWPAFSTYVDPTAGTPIGTGSVAYATAQVNGSFISRGRLYWPVSLKSGGNSPFGIQCLDLDALTSCGYTQLGTTSVVLYGLAGDGIAAADGNHYYEDLNGTLQCVSPTGTSCGSADLSGGAKLSASANNELGTYGRYVYVSYATTGNAAEFLSCYDTSARGICPGFPINVGSPGAYGSEVFPVVSSTGAFQGACAVYQQKCYDPTGVSIANPWSGTNYGYQPYQSQGFGTGVLVGTKYYTPFANQVNCYDFAQPLVAGKVQACASFTTHPADTRGYTVRELANLPGCLASDGDGAQISVFDAVTGGPCNFAAQSLKLTPSSYYCDGQPGHASTWGSVTLPGLNGSEYAAATLSLSDANGNPVPGWSDVPFPTSGPPTIDISSIPVSGTTTTLTASVTVTGISDLTAVNASRVNATWVGDSIQVCYRTVIPPTPCLQTTPVSNTATAVSTVAGVSDAPGADSGAVTFEVTPSDAQCMLHLTKTATPSPARPGDPVTYTIGVTNTGTQSYVATSPASFSDDIGSVLNDSTFDPASLSSSVGTAGYDPATKTISWSGPLAAGATATVTYTVTVDDPDLGDHLMTNRVVTPTGVPSNCAAASTDPDCAVDVPIQSFRVAKSTTATQVTPGGTVAYTVTVTNTGKFAYTAADPASFTDDLSGVLDDADYDSDADQGATYDPATKQLTWSGALPVGGSVTVTYSVTVHSPDTGDKVLDNSVVTPPHSGGNCAAGSTDPVCRVVLPKRSFSVAKTASKPSADAGDTVTYTLTVTNTGATAYTAADPVQLTDDLSGVLDDAVYNNDADNGATYDPAAKQLAWSGTLPVGGTTTITYSVTVNAPDGGDHSLQNTVTNPPGSGGNCVPGNSDPACLSVVPVREYVVTKTASTTSAEPGTTVSYTITAKNTGQVAYTAADPADVIDDLTGVLDDAVYNNDATNGATFTSPTLSWSGALGVGDTVTITYSVTVNGPDTGDHLLTNAAVGGANCPSGSTDPACAPAPIPVAEYTVTKTASTSVAHPGDVVRYSLTVHNTGAVAYTAADPATLTDNLANILDDATYNNDATNGATFASPVLSWAGALGVGQTVTIDYSVTVDQVDSGDHDLPNTVLGGDCLTPKDPGCSTDTQVQSYRVVKTADQAKAKPGTTITYRVTITNTGQVAYTAADPAGVTDDLTHVLDDAVYNNDADNGATYDPATKQLAWSGPLAVGSSVVITYSATVKSPDTGDQKITNTVVTTSDGGNCSAGSADPSCTANVPGRRLEIHKTASTTSAAPGQKVTYTITIKNTGATAFTAADPASISDDLTAVLDDARYNGDASQGATLSGKTLHWSGALPIGATIAITYSVTINPHDTGDKRLKNVVSAPVDQNSNCSPASTDPFCITVTPVRQYQVVKTTKARTVKPGQKVDYRITVTNTGQVPFTRSSPASFRDNLADVLDDATYNRDATHGATFARPFLSWKGALPVGGTVTITYSVTVHNPDKGNRTLHNVVTTPGQGGGIRLANCPLGNRDASCATATKVVKLPAPPIPVPGLPDTGNDVSLSEVLLGGGLAIVGGLLMLADRRRRRA